MSRRGNCYDNAAMESFFYTLKMELIYRRREVLAVLRGKNEESERKVEGQITDFGGLPNHARPTGLEPVTHSLEGCCSIHLSYGRV